MGFDGEIEYGKDLMVTDAYKQLLFQWFNNTARFYVESQSDFESGIDMIDSFLSYYRDVKYFDELKRINESVIKKINFLKEKRVVNKDISEEYNILMRKYSLARFKALVKLAGRNTFLPMPSIGLTVGLNDMDSDIEDANVDENVIVNERDMEKLEEEVKEIKTGIEEKAVEEKKEKIIPFPEVSEEKSNQIKESE